jgi:formylglycine-generating enzyme required for sulfatase activity
LLDGQRLMDAKRWLKLKPDELSLQEKSFIRKSIVQSIRTKAKIGAAVILPLSLLAGFFFWSANNNLPPKAGAYVLLAKTGVYILQPEMVLIPPDIDCKTRPCEFLMGANESDPDKSENEQPPHPVRFNKPFMIGKYEVTFDEYQVFAYLIAKDGGCKDRHEVGAVNDSGFGKGMRPVINVSWEDAQCYAEWLKLKTGKNYHLPSEAQWEYAAKAGTRTAYWWGDKVGINNANCSDCGSRWDNKSTAPVGSFKANPWGLFDMAGNVMEWVQDCWHDNYKNAPADGLSWKSQNGGDCRRRVLRGGSWDHDSWFLSSADRIGNYIGRYDFIGFRLAQD